MERNDNFGGTGGFEESTGSTGGALGGTGGYGNSGSTSGSAGYGAGGASYASTDTQAGYGTTDGGSSGGTSRVDQAKDKLGQARDAVGSGLGTVKEKASNLTASLADKLEAGAEKLRQRQGGSSGGASMAYAGGGTAAADDRMGAVNNQLAGGLQGAADWLREGDLRETIERQVRENPGRTLLIALGVGYLLGKTLRK